MIVPDANVLLYAYNQSAPQHAPARDWWEAALSASETVGLCWQTVTAFVRIATNPRAFTHPLSAGEAVDIVSEWLAQPVVQLIAPGGRHWGILGRLLIDSQITGPLVMDAHIAALAIEHGATLCTSDADFSRFANLRTMNPLAVG